MIIERCVEQLTTQDAVAVRDGECIILFYSPRLTGAEWLSLRPILLDEVLTPSWSAAVAVQRGALTVYPLSHHETVGWIIYGSHSEA